MQRPANGARQIASPCCWRGCAKATAALTIHGSSCRVRFCLKSVHCSAVHAHEHARLHPSLGLAWAHCVNTRLFAAKHGGGHYDGSVTRRRVQVRPRAALGYRRKGVKHKHSSGCSWQERRDVSRPFTFCFGKATASACAFNSRLYNPRAERCRACLGLVCRWCSRLTWDRQPVSMK